LWQAGTADVYDDATEEEVQREGDRILMRRVSHREDDDVHIEKMRIINTPLQQLIQQVTTL